MKNYQLVKTAIDLMLRSQKSTYERNGYELVFQDLKRRPKEILTNMEATRYVLEKGQIEAHVNVNEFTSKVVGDTLNNQIIVHISETSGSGWSTAKQIIYTLPLEKIEKYLDRLYELKPTWAFA